MLVVDPEDEGPAVPEAIGAAPAGLDLVVACLQRPGGDRLPGTPCLSF